MLHVLPDDRGSAAALRMPPRTVGCNRRLGALLEVLEQTANKPIPIGLYLVRIGLAPSAAENIGGRAPAGREVATLGGSRCPPAGEPSSQILRQPCRGGPVDQPKACSRVRSQLGIIT
jgi:hypothetical protein